MSDDIGMTDANDERDRIRDLEREVLRQRKRAEGFRQALDGSADIMVKASAALHLATRREDQIRALLELWAERCEAIVAQAVLGDESYDSRASTIAATTICAQDLAAMLACGNPDCPGCASKSADQPTTAGSGDDAPSP